MKKGVKGLTILISWTGRSRRGVNPEPVFSYWPITGNQLRGPQLLNFNNRNWGPQITGGYTVNLGETFLLKLLFKKKKKKKKPNNNQNFNYVHLSHFLNNQTAKNKNSQPNPKRYKTSAHTNLWAIAGSTIFWSRGRKHQRNGTDQENSHSDQQPPHHSPHASRST